MAVDVNIYIEARALRNLRRRGTWLRRRKWVHVLSSKTKRDSGEKYCSDLQRETKMNRRMMATASLRRVYSSFLGAPATSVPVRRQAQEGPRFGLAPRR